jgi:hypothetical protein
MINNIIMFMFGFIVGVLIEYIFESGKIKSY